MKFAYATRIEPIKVKPFSPGSPKKLPPKRIAATSVVNPKIPIRRKVMVLWFSYPEAKAKMLIGSVNNKIKLCINSLSKDNVKKPAERIIKEGKKKQWITQIEDNIIANLSDFNWVFIINLVEIS